MKIEKINEETNEVLLTDILEEEWIQFIKAGHKMSNWSDYNEESCFARYFKRTIAEYIERQKKELSCDS